MRPPPTSDNSTSVITLCPSVLRCLEVLTQLHGVYNYPPSDCAISQKTLFHTIWYASSVVHSVVQLLVKPGINSHPAQPPLMRPNVHTLRYLNFGQFRTPSNFRNCCPWDFCLLTHGHFVLSAKTCNVRLRPKSQTREWRCISASASHVKRSC